MIFFTINNFKIINKKLHNLGKISSTRETLVGSLKHEFNGHQPGSKWLIKDNQFDWIVNEYVASNLYQWVLGKDLVTDTVLLKNPNNSQKPLLAIKLHDNYLENFMPFDNNLKANDVTPKCLMEKKCTTLSGSIKIPIAGFEKAYIASRLFQEGDDSDLNNYAIIKKQDAAIVTRYDFDDSLKFFQLNGITQGMRHESLNKDMIQMLASKNIAVDDILSQINSGVYKREFGWNYFFGSLGHDLALSVFKAIHKRPYQFIEAFSHFTKLDANEMAKIIQKAFSEIKEISGEDIFSQYYNINQLNNYLPSSNDAIIPNSEKLAKYASEMIMDNLNKLKSMDLCLRVETYLKYNKISALKEMVDKQEITPHILCLSYFEMDFTHSRSEFNIYDFTKDYNNEASQYLLGNLHTHDEL